MVVGELPTLDAATAELEVQGLMGIHIFDCDGDDGSYGICQDDNSDTDYLEKSNELIDTRMLAIGGEKVHQLLAEHTIISEEFLRTATCLRFEEDNYDVLASKLNSLKNIWKEPQWEASLQHLCCYDEFRRAVLKIVQFFEEELKKSREESRIFHQTGQISCSTLISLVRLVIPLLLKLLRFVHALWADEAEFRLSEELKEAKSMNICEQTFSQDLGAEVNELRQWLQLIRESGYNFLGLCAPIKGAFSELLDSSSINDAIMENLSSMEFRHVTKLIDLVIVPFIKHCPHKLWEEWMWKLLLPLFSYCEDVLYDSWFSLLNNGRANVPYYFGHLCGSEETVRKMEDQLLLDLKRKVSKLLGALASPELNAGIFHADLHCASDMMTASRDLKCTSSSSVVGYILLNDCFRRLSMKLFGWWVDVEATIAAVPFCSALVQVATRNGKLRRFVEDDMLPALIQRLYDGLPCAVQQTIEKLSYQMNLTDSNKARKDLLVLCQDVYKVCVQSQDLESEELGNGNTAYGFEDWFEKQKADLSVKAAWTRPDEFPIRSWTWEFEEEFQRHLATYIDLLHEVDAMDDCLEYDCSDHPMLFVKLSPEFRTKHAIDNCMDHHLLMISDIVQRKKPAAYYENRYDQMVKWLWKLITLTPYIKLSDSWGSAMHHLKENFEINLDHFELDAEHAVDIFFDSILFFWEPRFHPLIREGQKDILLNIACQLVLAEDSKCYKPLEVNPKDFMEHLRPYAQFYFDRKKKEFGYFTAREQVNLHEEFDRYLASGELDSDIYKFSSLKDDFVKKLADKHIARSRFAGLNPKLVKLSLEQRAQIVDRQRQIDTYSECLKHMMTDEKLKNCLQEVMSGLELEGFFDVNNNSIDWGKKSFVDLIDNFKKIVFREHSFPRYLVIQGIMDYREISQRVCTTWQDPFKEVVEVVSHRWKEDLAQIWMDTRYYEGLYYDLLRQPLKKMFARNVEAPKPKYLQTKRRASKRSSRVRLKRQN